VANGGVDRDSSEELFVGHAAQSSLRPDRRPA
jgi:hypothetical protein